MTTCHTCTALTMEHLLYFQSFMSDHVQNYKMLLISTKKPHLSSVTHLLWYLRNWFSIVVQENMCHWFLQQLTTDEVLNSIRMKPNMKSNLPNCHLKRLSPYPIGELITVIRSLIISISCNSTLEESAVSLYCHLLENDCIIMKVHCLFELGEKITWPAAISD